MNLRVMVLVIQMVVIFLTSLYITFEIRGYAQH